LWLRDRDDLIASTHSPVRSVLRLASAETASCILLRVRPADEPVRACGDVS
jgi:hypothetical protein